MSTRRRLLFFSQYAFHRPLYAVFEFLRNHCDLDGHLVFRAGTSLPRVYARDGFLSPQSAGLSALPDFASVLPTGATMDSNLALLRRLLDQIRPDFIWAHEEPNDPYVNGILRHFYFNRRPRIAIAVVENMWPAPGGNRARWARFERRRLWRRYNGVLAAATKSIESVRKFGMPAEVPAYLAWLPTLPPDSFGASLTNGLLPEKQPGEFFIGFAGRITAAKGWKVLLAALTLLPENFKCLMAGAGDEEAELLLWRHQEQFRSRVHFAGVLSREQLSCLYRASDLFVLPSLSTPSWTEQFGSVLAEAMSCGTPVVGSSSGAIPEVIGDCGLVVEENNPTALAAAIKKLADDTQLRAALAKKGLERFRRDYSVEAYAQKVLLALGAAPENGVVSVRGA